MMHLCESAFAEAHSEEKAKIERLGHHWKWFALYGV